MATHSSPRLLLIWAIGLYQRHLSSCKGYGCAYRLHHGRGSGCSGVGLRAVRRHGIFRGLRILKVRLQRCSEVSRSQRSALSAHRIAASQRGDCDCGGDCVTLPCEFCGEIGFDRLWERCKAWWQRQNPWVRGFLIVFLVAGLLTLLTFFGLWWHAP